MATKNTYDVVLEKVGNQQLKTTKALCGALGLGLAAAKGMVDKAPTTVAKGLDKDKALALKKELEALGNTVSIPGIETKTEAPATKKTTTTKKQTTKKSAPSSSKAATPSNDDFDAIFGGDTAQKETKPQAKAPQAKIERIEYASGNVYEGEMKDGLRNGVGTFRWSNGDVYIGEYVNDVRQGKGKFLYASGNVYEGDFFNGNFHGYGVFRWADGDVYEGEWKNDERHGNGKYTYADGSYYTGVWENGDIIDSTKIDHPAPSYASESVKPAAGARIERIEFDNGDVYEGEMVNGLRHGKGKYTWANGDFYEGEWAKGWRSGFGIYKSHSKNEVDGSTFASYVYEGDWKNSKKHGHGVATGYKAIASTGCVCFDWSYDGEWIEDNRHGNGKYTYADGSYFTGVWENNKKISASETISPAGTEDCIEEVYEQDVDTADNGFETMTDYYTACLDEDSTLFDDGFGHLHSAVKHIEPYFQAVIENLEDRDPATAQEFLAEIVQVDLLALNEATANDGIFSSEELQLYDLCECALKCAYNECIANPNELTETAMLHFAYYLYNEYSTLNERSPSNFFMYYLDYYIQTYGIEENIMWDIGALYFARIFVNDQQYSAIPEGEVYYELEEIYGEFLDGLFEDDNIDIYANVQGRLYDSEIGYINAEEIEEESSDEKTYDGIETFETESGNTYRGYVDSEGRCHGWGEMKYADGNTYFGFFEHGYRQGFGINYIPYDGIIFGNYENGYANGLCFERSLLVILEDDYEKFYPMINTYFENGDGVPSPDFGYPSEGHRGAYSEDTQYFGYLDEDEYAHGYCILWTSSGDPRYHGEGMYEHGNLKFGLRTWLYPDESTTWAYGPFIRNSDGTGYLLNTTPEHPIGQKGSFKVDSFEEIVTLEFYDVGEFKNNYLNGRGTRVFPDGLTISGYFINGGVARIERVVLPNGEEADPADYTHYLSEKQSSEITWDELSDMSTEEKDAFFAECPILIVPKGVKKIPEYMFYKCENLQGVYFNEDLEEIGKNAFAWCKNLGPVLEIPQSVYRIAESAFSVCNSIRTIYLPNNITVAKWGFMCGVHNVFFETDPPRGVILDNGAFSDSDMVMSKDMIKKIKAINRRAFK